MIRPYARELATAAVQLSHYPQAAAILHQLGQDHAPDWLIDAINGYLEKSRELCAVLEMKSSTQRINRLLGSKPAWTNHQLAMDVKEVSQQIIDDLSELYFFHVPSVRVDFYDKPIFGEKVERRFSSAIADIREAGNCFALGRWTGVVHHCMGAVQVGLTVLAEHLGISIDILVDDWNTIITKIEGAITVKRKDATRAEATDDQKSRWRRAQTFYNEIMIDVRAIKDAWRNPTAHFRRQYDETSSKKVLEKVGDFMRNLADNLPN
jgi:hypothetical protein